MPMCTPGNEMQRGQFELLLDQAQACCRDSMGTLLQIDERLLRSKIHEILPEDLKAHTRESDLFQDVMADAQRSIKSFHGKSREEFASWLMQIALHNCEDLLRYWACGKRNPNGQLSLDDPEQIGTQASRLKAKERNPAELALVHEEQKLLAEAWLKLSSGDRALIEVRNIEGLSFEEIGKRLGASAETATRLHSHAFRRLSS